MGHTIPVFFGPADPEKLPGRVDEWNDVAEFVAAELNGLYQAASRNWWLQAASLHLAAHLGLGGLDFLSSEVVVLSRSQTEAALHAVDAVLQGIRSGLLAVPLPSAELGGLESNTQLQSLLSQALPTRELSAPDGYGAAPVGSFLTFLVSLRAALTAALSSGQAFLYVQPQP